MKLRTASFLIGVAFLTAALPGCDKPPAAPPNSPTNTPTAAWQESLKEVATAAATEAKKVGAEIKTTAEQAMRDVTQEVQNLTASATVKAQEYIDKARALVSQQKYQDALAALKELGNLSLSPEQQKAVTDLRDAIQRALGATDGANGSNAVNRLLNQ